MTSRHGDALPVADISILWLTAGLGCDGDTIAMTAATQPSLEDLLSGALPWTPKVKLHNPFLAPEVGDEFVRFFHRGAAGELDPFILVVEGSIPDETNKAEGYWATFGTDPGDRPADHDLRMDRPARAARRGRSSPPGTCAAYGGIHAMEGNPTGCMGLPDYLGWEWRSASGHSDRLHAGLSGAAGQHDRDAALPAPPGRRAARR